MVRQFVLSNYCVSERSLLQTLGTVLYCGTGLPWWVYRPYRWLVAFNYHSTAGASLQERYVRLPERRESVMDGVQGLCCDYMLQPCICLQISYNLSTAFYIYFHYTVHWVTSSNLNLMLEHSFNIIGTLIRIVTVFVVCKKGSSVLY
jgi:hypothetical protein